MILKDSGSEACLNSEACLAYVQFCQASQVSKHLTDDWRSNSITVVSSVMHRVGASLKVIMLWLVSSIVSLAGHKFECESCDPRCEGMHP